MSYNFRLICYVLFVVKATSLFSQNKKDLWDLEACQFYAIQNNITVLKANVPIQRSEKNKKLAFLANLPTLNASGDQAYNWGRRIDIFSNEFAIDQIQTNNFSLESDWVLSSGLQNYYLKKKLINEIAFNESNKKIVIQNTKIKVASAYLEVLMNHYAYEASREQVNYSNKLLEQQKVLVELQQKTKTDLLKVDAQLALDKARMTVSQNNFQQSILALKQTINLNDRDSFDVVIDTSLINNIDNYTIDDTKQRTNVEIESAQLLEQLTEYDVKISKGKKLPRLSLRGLIGTGFSENNIVFTDNGEEVRAFKDQLNQNFNQSIALVLNIPIFNRGSVASEIVQNRFALAEARLNTKEATQELQNKIQQLDNEINNLKANLKSAKNSVSYLKKVMQLDLENYKESVINFSELSLSRANFLKAKLEYIKTQFTYLFKTIVLSYYYE